MLHLDHQSSRSNDNLIWLLSDGFPRNLQQRPKANSGCWQDQGERNESGQRRSQRGPPQVIGHGRLRPGDVVNGNGDVVWHEQRSNMFFFFLHFDILSPFLNTNVLLNQAHFLPRSPKNIGCTMPRQGMPCCTNWARPSRRQMRCLMSSRKRLQMTLQSLGYGKNGTAGLHGDY